MTPSRQNPGYIALLSVLIVSAIAASSIIVLFITSLNSRLNSSNIHEGRISRILADACAELAIQRLSDGVSDPCPSPCNTAYAFPSTGGMCRIIEINNTSGPNWRIRTTGSGVTNAIVKHIEIQAVRSVTGSAATVMSWKEVDGTSF